jgi:N-acetylneuraminic acid mutarotase
MKLLNTHTRERTIMVAAVLLVAMNALAFGASGTWSSTGSMLSARDGHTATLLVNGKVLVAGGTNNGVALTSAELYNRTTGTWASTGSMRVARTLAHAVLLSNGAVLVMGGCVNDCLSTTTNSAELYNPTAGTFRATGSMVQARAEFAITLLANGQVLVAGGCTAYDANGCASTTNKAEIYNPATGTWKATTALRAARHAMTAAGKRQSAGGRWCDLCIRRPQQYGDLRPYCENLDFGHQDDHGAFRLRLHHAGYWKGSVYGRREHQWRQHQ